MSNNIEGLRQLAHEAETTKATQAYQNISPLINFGEGGVPTLERIVRLEQASHVGATIGLADINAGGWMALEIASQLPDPQLRSNYFAKASSRFEYVAKHGESTEYQDRAASYAARLGLVAVDGYRDPVATTIDDTPGIYADILTDLLADKKFKGHDSRKRVGLISSLTVAIMASEMGYLTLPAGLRHSQPLSILVPSRAYDFALWRADTEKLPAKPHRRLQVRTSQPVDFHYAPNITVVSTREDLRETNTFATAQALSRHYRGRGNRPSQQKRLKTNRRDLRNRLAVENSENSVTYNLRGSSMRGGRPGKTRILRVGQTGYKPNNR